MRMAKTSFEMEKTRALLVQLRAIVGLPCHRREPFRRRLIFCTRYDTCYLANSSSDLWQRVKGIKVLREKIVC